MAYLIGGGNITREINLTISSGDMRRAFEMLQAVIWGADYVKEMHGINIGHISVNYPSNIANNNNASAYFGKRIYLITNASWDDVLHEYGHHIGLMLGIDKHPAQGLEFQWDWPPLVYDYDWEDSMFDASEGKNYSKSQSIRISWAEAWAEFFSKMVRNYYWQNLNGISDIGGFDIAENPNNLVANGEASIRSIEAVMWRVYRDILNKGNINDIIYGDQSIKNTHKVLWNSVVQSQAGTEEKSFSAFANYFINKYTEYRSEFGKISAIHGMSPAMLSISSYSASLTPTVSWKNGYSSTKFPNNKYSLVFYNSSNVEILRINNLTTTSHKLSNANWQQILNTLDYNVNIYVISYEINTPSTGGFISQGLDLSLFIFSPINQSSEYLVSDFLGK